MLSSFAFEADQTKVETVFGWGKFYGRLKHEEEIKKIEHDPEKEE